MRRNRFFPAAALCLLLTASLPGCRRAEPASVARIDTLPGGVLRVTSDAPTGWRDSTHAWKVKETLRIQPPEGAPGELIDPGQLAVDAQGRIYLSDQKPVVIKVFDSTGVLVRTIGREGGGPGEYHVALIAVRGERLVVHDPSLARTTVFDTAGTYLRSWPSSCCYWADIGIDSASRIYLPSMVVPDSGKPTRGRAYSRYGMDGMLVDTLYVPEQADMKSWTFTSGTGTNKRSTMIMNVPFTPMTSFALHPDGGFVRGWTGEYRIVRAPRGEDSTMVMSRKWIADAIPGAMRTELVEKVVTNATQSVGEAAARGVARLGDVPTSAPAFTSLKVDMDGNVWARRLVGSDSTWVTFDVFSPDGMWLGPLTVPFAIPQWGGQFFGHGAIYAVIEDADGRPAIVKLKLEQ
ncbi:MAG: hypothetical protein SGJ01_07435 [Gemmatimonadota bacterium]|nr:hypothetical protein [Gemmatimonadota bacterium]